MNSTSKENDVGILWRGRESFGKEWKYWELINVSLKDWNI